MNTKLKKTLLGAIVTLILVAMIVLVVLAVSGHLSPLTSLKTKTIKPNLPKTASKRNVENVDQLLAVFSKIVKADEHRHLFVVARVMMIDKDKVVMHNHREAAKIALKSVEVRGTNEDQPLKKGDEEHLRKEVAAMELIGNELVIGKPEPEGIKKGQDALLMLRNTLKQANMAFKAKSHGGCPLSKEDGDDTVYYLMKE